MTEFSASVIESDSRRVENPTRRAFNPRPRECLVGLDVGRNQNRPSLRLRDVRCDSFFMVNVGGSRG